MIQQFKTTDGLEVSLRPLGPADALLEKKFIENLCPIIKYHRFFNCFNCPTPKQLNDFTLFDCEKEQAFTVLFGEKEKQIQIAVGRICRLTDQTCEFAILVADRWQKRGIGSYLLEKLKSEALQRKFSKIQGYLLSYNSQMISLAKAHGFKIESVPKDNLVLAVYTFNK